MKDLPRGYGCAAEEPPAEVEQRCECGHSREDHNDAPDTDAMDTALHQILEYFQKGTYRQALSPWYIAAHVEIVALRGLSVCSQCENCLKFEPVDPHDDGDAAYDAAHGN